MWTLVNDTPFAAERAWVRDKDGAEVWVVAVRATFDFSPQGELRLSDPQVPVCQFATYEEDDGNAALLEDTDLVECKGATDVLVNGTAYAPGGQPTPQWHVRVQVDTIDKALLVSGPRRWLQEGDGAPRLSDPEPITSLPLRYAAAFGGGDLAAEEGAYVPENPVGCGFASESPALADQPVPSVEYAARPIGAWNDYPPPAGFGPVSASWSPRREAAGTHDDQWLRERYPLPPTDRDVGFFQSAPLDQQCAGFLRGGETLRLQGLTKNGFVALRLPNARFDVATQFADGSHRRHRMQLYTVIVEPDQERLGLVWHTHLRCHQQVNQLLSTRVLLKRQLHGKPGSEDPPWLRQA